jgi:LysR family glycine cleavage system transcriptional activator
MDNKKIPNLAALRAFEAVVRHKGLTGAADELSVTPSAISHRLRQLETDVGIKLFTLNGRRLALTTAGEELVFPLSDAFEKIRRAVADTRRLDANRPLMITMLHNIAVNWFLPRLPEFSKLHPDIEVRLFLTAEFIDFSLESADMAIRYSTSPWPDLHCETLLEDRLTPLCSPEFLNQHGPLTSPDDLKSLPLIASSTRLTDDWGSWFRMTGHAPSTSNRQRVIVDSTHLSMQAAANGLGVAIAGLALANPMISRNALVAPYTESVAERGTYYIVCPEDWRHQKKIKRMRNWLMSQT